MPELIQGETRAESTGRCPSRRSRCCSEAGRLLESGVPGRANGQSLKTAGSDDTAADRSRRRPARNPPSPPGDPHRTRSAGPNHLPGDATPLERQSQVTDYGSAWALSRAPKDGYGPPMCCARGGSTAGRLGSRTAAWRAAAAAAARIACRQLHPLGERRKAERRDRDRSGVCPGCGCGRASSPGLGHCLRRRVRILAGRSLPCVHSRPYACHWPGTNGSRATGAPVCDATITMLLPAYIAT